ncbi:flagellar biosynthetic protein FliO [Cellulomonas sp. zg-ZUI199]|uniref:Flagellar biosynthetic protein FliO n=1 Tax=Cellulomonas wangleii TaxID=2816956 RepID=A0ABX8D6G7_9CELL|nr:MULTISPECIES: flagellar biosynthetic protein FliO [Cellulomonas]MBO0901262.1 flagellar biosynthetic protein FliO [Cellulomonas sp. zg-ZUI22]MBO0924870.1 flagellar biosynthetic protein FliO [Cellulomonas wangleii]QVI63036.1 flagellar biosynthetic protein FliO [Cellulomonas wangleii]
MDELLLVGRVLLSLACVVGLIWYLARRFGASRPAADDREPRVRVVDRQALGRTSGVAVVAVGSRRLLVGFGEQQVALLTELGPVVERPPTVGADAVVPAPRTPDTAAAAGPLAGSVLSPQTWRATVRALQDRTVRR